MPWDRVKMIDLKLNNLYIQKSNGDNSKIINYYIQELNRIKDEAYKHQIISHLRVYIYVYYKIKLYAIYLIQNKYASK